MSKNYDSLLLTASSSSSTTTTPTAKVTLKQESKEEKIDVQIRMAILLLTIFVVLISLLILYLRIKCFIESHNNRILSSIQEDNNNNIDYNNNNQLYFVTPSNIIVTREQIEILNQLENDLTIDLSTISGCASIERMQNIFDLPPPSYNDIVKCEESLPSYEIAIQMNNKK